MPTPIHALPSEYREVRHLVATESRTLLWLNVASLVPLILALLVMGWWWSTVRQLRGPISTAFSESLHWLPAVMVVLVVTFGGHELIHGLAIRWAGHRPRFGMNLSKGVFYATADSALFPRNHFVIIALAPLVVLTLIGMGLMVFVPDSIGYYVGLVVVLNAGGAIGDLWMTAVVLRYPPDALVRDEADRIRIYTA
ncbi:MAG: hypothetical protein CL610_22520 [Anaerolineaceae bacterium]|nr:hypothetical protein [Anaerolineaceae bacterium]